MAASEEEVAGRRRRPVQRPATGEVTQERRGGKVGQGGEKRDGYLGTESGAQKCWSHRKRGTGIEGAPHRKRGEARDEG